MKNAGFVLFLLIFAACEKPVSIQPASQAPRLVVDAQIENGQPVVVQLSNSINYFSRITRQMLQNTFVHNATVTLSDGTLSEVLKEYRLAIDSGYFIYYYRSDSAASSRIIGQPGKTYRLDIKLGTDEYSATTTIPLLSKTMDSLWWRLAPRVEDTPRVVLIARVTDPPGYGNYIRYFTRRNSEQFLPGANSVFDDQIVDGVSYEIQVDGGINRNDPPEEEDYGFFRRGDTVTVKFANIDKVSYDFWRTLEFSYQSVGNPFSSPVKVLGNINNNALGAFCGYAVQYRTLIIPK